MFEEKEDWLDQDEQDKTAGEIENLYTKWNLERADSEQHKIDHGSRSSSPIVEWYDDHLHWIHEESQFVVCRKWCDMPAHGLCFHMTSHLLMYRLALLFGKSLWEEADGYKSCWEIRILHSDHHSVLRFWDSKGSARIFFCGRRESQNDALSLVNLVARWKFPHTYDGVIAGRMA
jgi:hypothetical protein